MYKRGAPATSDTFPRYAIKITEERLRMSVSAWCQPVTSFRVDRLARDPREIWRKWSADLLRAGGEHRVRRPEPDGLDQQARHPNNQIIGRVKKDHLEPAIGSRRVRVSGIAATQRAAIAQNPCAPKRSKIGPQVLGPTCGKFGSIAVVTEA